MIRSRGGYGELQSPLIHLGYQLKSRQMQEPFDETKWANKLETGLEAITFLEINDPTKVINDAVDSLFANMSENVDACEVAINNISNNAFRDIAIARLHYKKIERFTSVLPHEFLYPQDENEDIVFLEEFDSRVFTLWANVNKSLLGLEEAMTCLRDDIATAIRNRIENPDFDKDFEEWVELKNEEARIRADEDKKRVDIDETLSKAVESGAAGTIIFLLVAAALMAPLVSMCTQK